jgi:MoxR-like ATPase
MANKDKPFVFEDWVELDLSRADREGRLQPVFGLGDTLQQLDDLLVAEGKRTPVLTGPPGVGKSALVHAIVAASSAGRGPPCFAGARFVQLSLRSIASHFKEASDGTDTVQAIFDHILRSPEPIVPFVRDVHVAFTLDWESSLLRFASGSPRPFLGEASGRQLRTMIDCMPDLGEWLVDIPVDEPSVERTRTIVAQWADDQHRRTGRIITPVAQRAAIDLTGRFIGNRHFPRKALDLLREARDLAPGEGTVGLREVIQRFSSNTRVPPALVDPAIHLDIAATRRFVTDRLLGQDEAADAVVRVIALIKANLADPRRPFGVFLFVGPTGVGKTHTAQLLADYFFGDKSRMIRVNLSDFATPAGHAQLFGSASAHNLEGRRGELARRLGNAPFGVLLLDELEKADRAVHDGLLQLVDEGRYINGNGETVSLRSLIVIATSNAGAEVYRESGVGFADSRDTRSLDAELDRRVLGVFRFEFLNRFDRVVHFHPLSRATIRAIAQRELAWLLDREGLRGRQLKVEVDADVLDWLVAHGYHPHFGARFLRREMERDLVGPLATFIVGHGVVDEETLVLGVRAGRIEVRRAAVEREAVAAPVGPQVDADVEAALRTWAPLREGHAARRMEAQALLDASVAPDFWADAVAANGVLCRYRTLDARLAAESRLLGTVRALEDLAPDADEETVRARCAAAWSAQRRWRQFEAADGDDGAFLVISPAEASRRVEAEFLTELVAIEKAWLGRLGLDAGVVAEEMVGERVVGVVFEVEGPGLAHVLAMEVGVHRRRRPTGDADRLLVEVLPRRPGHVGGALRDLRRGAGTYLPEVRARVDVTLEDRGLTRLFRGVDRDTLSLLAGAVGAAGPSEGVPARAYHYDGVAVRDLRTGAIVLHARDLRRGALEPLRSAWDARTP